MRALKVSCSQFSTFWIFSEYSQYWGSWMCPALNIQHSEYSQYFRQLNLFLSQYSIWIFSIFEGIESVLVSIFNILIINNISGNWIWPGLNIQYLRELNLSRSQSVIGRIAASSSATVGQRLHVAALLVVGGWVIYYSRWVVYIKVVGRFIVLIG